MRYLCQPCEHRWWQHRHPDLRMQVAGLVLMVVGALEVAYGLAVLL